MLRSLASRSAFAVAIAVIWSAAMIGFAMVKETPVGVVEGRVTGSDTKGPIEGAEVWISQKVKGKTKGFNKNAVTGKDGRFRFANVPVGAYSIQAGAQVHSLPKAVINVSEGKVIRRDLDLKPGEPYFNLYVSQQIFTPKETPSMSIDGFTKSGKLTLTIYRVKADQLLTDQAEPVLGILTGGWWDSAPENLSSNPAIGTSETKNIDITKRDSEGVYHQAIALENQQPGIYVLTARTGGIEHVSWFSVSNLGIVTKQSGQDMLIYATRPDSGEPIPDVDIKILEGKKVTASGRTDASGLWKNVFPAVTGAVPNRLILAQSGDSVAFVNLQLYEEVSGPFSIYSYTDRPVYRPGHQVHFKGIVRKFENESYHTTQDGEAKVEVRDRRGSLVYTGSHPLNRFGSFYGDFKLPDYAPTGVYDIVCSYQGKEETSNFEVAEYRKPEFTVDIEMPKKQCTRGDKIKAKVRASYYFGAPVAGAEVHYSVSQSDYWSFSDDEDGYDGEFEGGYEDYGGYGETVSEGVVRTGADGTATVEFNADWKQPDDEYYTNDKRFTLSAYVTEANGRTADGEGSIIATQGDFQINVVPDQYLCEPGKSATFNIEAADYDEKPQSGVDVEITANREEWNGEEQEFTEVAKSTVRTGADGQASFTFRPSKPGSYTVRATCRDRNGHAIKRATWLWVSGDSGDLSDYKYPDLSVVLDKKMYSPGDTAKLLINTKDEGASALVTIEGRKLYDYRVVKLAKRSTVVEIPVTSNLKPNFYVGVCFVKNKRLANQEARARVSIDAQTIKLSVTPDRKKYEPGDNAIYTVKAVDTKGRPVQAEVSLGVVDEAIYDIREDNTTPIAKFFYARRPNSVSTRYSFPEVYLSGDKAGFTGKVRKEFVDTAYWQATLVTDEKGEARASFKMPDNLTTWRATARACSMDTSVGQCTSSAVVTKKLLVRLQTPRFLVQEDQANVTALVHNYTAERQDVRVALKASGLGVKGPAERTISVESEGVGSVTWQVKAGKLGNVSLTAYAVAPVAQDAMELTIPVRPHGQRQVESRAGQITDSEANETLTVKRSAVEDASEIRVRLAPSYASTILGSLDYLAEYPYGCNEQTMSAFLPDVVLWKTLKELNIDKPDLKKRLPDMVGKGLNRLYDSQNYEGGWGWCEYAEEDPWMTAYVVYGLLTARAAGFDVDHDVLDNGLSALQRQVAKPFKPKEDPHNRIYGLYVLSLTGKKRSGE